jgi:UDPglucose--hexose-1-phosphate uridylyltransferase
MSEVRRDPIRGLEVIVAEERARPVRIDPGVYTLPASGAARAAQSAVSLGFPAEDGAHHCPLCPGHEARTPPEVLAYRSHGGAPNDNRWSVRVVPSALPALRVENTLARDAVGFFDRWSGVGAHEVIIESPAHVASLDELGEAPIALAAEAWQSRLVDLARDTRLRHALLFKRVGAAAGAALFHAHSQLVGLPLVPHAVRAELAAFAAHAAAHERCILCDVLRSETEAYVRVVHDNAGFVVLTPFASRVPFEVWVVPRGHAANFESIDAQGRAHFANAMYVALRRIRVALAGTPFCVSLWNVPFDATRAAASAHVPPVTYHFRVEIAPVLTAPFGPELGAGVHLNAISPETAAQLLREVTIP